MSGLRAEGRLNFEALLAVSSKPNDSSSKTSAWLLLIESRQNSHACRDPTHPQCMMGNAPAA